MSMRSVGFNSMSAMQKQTLAQSCVGRLYAKAMVARFQKNRSPYGSLARGRGGYFTTKFNDSRSESREEVP